MGPMTRPAAIAGCQFARHAPAVGVLFALADVDRAGRIGGLDLRLVIEPRGYAVNIRNPAPLPIRAPLAKRLAAIRQAVAQHLVRVVLIDGGRFPQRDRGGGSALRAGGQGLPGWGASAADA